MNTTQKRSFGRRINAWLDEPDGEQFTDGKWRFWLPAVLGFSILNAALTVMIFRETASANYLTPALLAASGIVGWIAIGCLHYSDAKRGRMARGVSALDSASLLFTLGHFCFLVYILGHGWILRGADADYRAALKEYNANAQAFHAGNEKIADALRDAEAARKETAKIEQDTAYQLRQAAKHGAQINTQRAGGITANIEMAKVELPPPPKAPEDSQAAFLTRWDAWVRITNFGELILAAVTLIFIRNWTAKANTPATSQPIQMTNLGERTYRILPDGRREIIQSTYSPDEIGKIIEPDDNFPDELDDVGVIEKRSPSRRADLAKAPDKNASFLMTKKETAKKHASFDSEGLKRLREALKDISFRLPGLSFKSYVRGDAVWILMMRANQGTQETIASAKAALSILDDAMTMERRAFRERLETFLRKRGFEL